MRARRRHRRRRPLAAALLAIIALTICGVAYGYWSGSGGGAGSATTGTTLAVTLSPGTPTAVLYPGGHAGVAVSAANPNPFAVHLGSLALDTAQGEAGFAVDAGHSGCTLTTLGFPAQTNGGAGWTVPANGSLPVVLAGALTMGVDAANACQGATFSVYLATGS